MLKPKRQRAAQAKTVSISDSTEEVLRYRNVSAEKMVQDVRPALAHFSLCRNTSSECHAQRMCPGLKPNTEVGRVQEKKVVVLYRHCCGVGIEDADTVKFNPAFRMRREEVLCGAQWVIKAEGLKSRGIRSGVDVLYFFSSFFSSC